MVNTRLPSVLGEGEANVFSPFAFPRESITFYVHNSFPAVLTHRSESCFSSCAIKKIFPSQTTGVAELPPG